MSEITHPTGKQLAAARALAGLGQAELAERARISLPTLRRMEASEGLASGLANNVLAVVGVLQSAGIQFVTDGEIARGTGVTFKATAD